MANGRIAFIDYVAYAGIRGLRVGRIRLRWLDALEPIPDHVVRVAGISEPVLIRAELAPVMVQERAALKVSGSRLPRPFHRLAITVADGGPWLAFVERRATPLGLPTH
jgi:hypothetical protein